MLRDVSGGSDPSPGLTPEASEAAREVIELLEVLWERGREALSTTPVSPSQLRVLYSLERDEGMNLRALGEVLGAAPSSASRLCDRLAAVGFVERLPSAVSRRELELRLTGEGRAYLVELRAQREKVLSATIESMSPQARAAFVDGLRGFRSAAEEGASVRPLRAARRRADDSA